MCEFNTELFPGTIKLAMKEAGAKEDTLWQVPIEQLHIIDGFNVRTHDEEYQNRVRHFADVMKVEGFYQHKPLAGYVAKVGEEQVIYIYDGQTRLDAAWLAISEGAEIERLPVVVKQKGLSAEDLTITLALGNEGTPLTPIETAEVCKRLVKFNLTQTDIATRLGVSPAYVGSLLSLLEAPIAVREMVKSKQVSAALAVETIRKHGNKATEKLQEAHIASGGKKVTAKHLQKEKVQKFTIDKIASAFAIAKETSYSNEGITFEELLAALQSK